MTTSTTSGTRTVRVSAGDVDYVWFNVTDITGQNISGDTAQVGFGTWYDPPTSPITPDGPSDQVQHPVPTQVRVGLLIGASDAGVGAHVIPPGSYEGWIKVSDSPTVAWVRCGKVEII